MRALDPTKPNIWRDLCAYFNNVPIGKIVTRQQIVEAFGSKNVIDVYRNYLTRAGYLETEAPGRYKRLKDIPEEFTLTTLKKEMNPFGSKFKF